jgi:hypothetical protein
MNFALLHHAHRGARPRRPLAAKRGTKLPPTSPPHHTCIAAEGEVVQALAERRLRAGQQAPGGAMPCAGFHAIRQRRQAGAARRRRRVPADLHRQRPDSSAALASHVSASSRVLAARCPGSVRRHPCAGCGRLRFKDGLGRRPAQRSVVRRRCSPAQPEDARQPRRMDRCRQLPAERRVCSPLRRQLAVSAGSRPRGKRSWMSRAGWRLLAFGVSCWRVSGRSLMFVAAVGALELPGG